MVPDTVELLKNDGKEELYHFLNSTPRAGAEKYCHFIARGARDADIPWSRGYILQLYHFHHPWTHRGYLCRKSSADQLAQSFAGAQNLWTSGRKERALYQLGRMLHLIQDIFVPHHAGVTARRGHAELERWLAIHWRHYLVEEGGCYIWEETFASSDSGQIHAVSSKNPYDWIDKGSHISIRWYERYFQDYEGQNGALFFPEVASKIIPCTLRHSAGFINRFFTGLALTS